MVTRTRRMDILLLVIIIIIAIVIFIFYKINLKEGNTVVVIYNDNIIYTHSLSEDTEKIITTELGMNELKIKDGKVSVIEANCPDKLCIYQKSIDKVGENIVCLPHKLIVKITNANNSESEVDSISN